MALHFYRWLQVSPDYSTDSSTLNHLCAHLCQSKPDRSFHIFPRYVFKIKPRKFTQWLEPHREVLWASFLSWPSLSNSLIISLSRSKELSLGFFFLLNYWQKLFSLFEPFQHQYFIIILIPAESTGLKMLQIKVDNNTSHTTWWNMIHTSILKKDRIQTQFATGVS